MARFARAEEFTSRTAPVVDFTGARLREVALEPSVFGRRPNVALIHQVVVGQLAGVRAGTQSTKTRSEVRGGGAKPYRQKGTGRARQGSTNAPQFSGGGVALGPKPRSYAQRTPKKMIAQALYGSLSDRAEAGAVFVLGGFDLTTPSTKAAQRFIDAMKFESSVLVVVEPGDETLAKSLRNLPNVEVAFPSNLSAYLVLVNDAIVFTEGSLPRSQAGESLVVEGRTVAPVDGNVVEAVTTEETEVVEEGLD